MLISTSHCVGYALRTGRINAEVNTKSRAETEQLRGQTIWLVLAVRTVLGRLPLRTFHASVRGGPCF